MVRKDVSDEVFSSICPSLFQDIEKGLVDSGAVEVIREGVELIGKFNIVLEKADSSADIDPGIIGVF